MTDQKENNEEMREYADLLKADGHEITASWVYGGEEGLTFEDIATVDLNDISQADTLVHFTEPYGSYNPGGGAHTEYGFAAALGLDLIVVGQRQQVFHWLPETIHFPDFVSFRHYLKGKKNADFQGIPDPITGCKTRICTCQFYSISDVRFNWGSRGDFGEAQKDLTGW
jgi:hypothetical protein